MFYTCGFTHMRPHLRDGMSVTPTMVVASNYLSGSGKVRVRLVPEQCRPLFCDSGGFYFHFKGTDYPFSPADYIAWLTAMAPDYAACMDYPCEAEVAADDAAVFSRQVRCIDHARVLLACRGCWEWLPVLQGRTVAQYLRHVDMYRAAGLVTPYMGIGSLCRRTRIDEIQAIIHALTEALPGTRFHLFGVKMQIFKQADALPESVASADSGAWNGMFGPGRERWKSAQARGLTQAEYEVREALPAYRGKLTRAFETPKQLTMWGIAT